MKITHAHPRHLSLLLAALVALPVASFAAGEMADTAPAPAQTPPENPAPSPAEIVSRDLNRSDAVNVRLATRNVTNSIEDASFASRDPVIGLAQRGVTEGRAITAALKAASRILNDKDREEVELAVLKAEQARERLGQAISKAYAATEPRWSNLREELSERYETYATALENARKEAIDNGVKFEPAPLAPAPAEAFRN